MAWVMCLTFIIVMIDKTGFQHTLISATSKMMQKNVEYLVVIIYHGYVLSSPPLQGGQLFFLQVVLASSALM